MYFQLEVDYYSNEVNKNKYKNVQLIASTKNNLKIATDCTGHCTRNENLSYFVAWTSKYLKVGIINFIQLIRNGIQVIYICSNMNLLANLISRSIFIQVKDISQWNISENHVSLFAYLLVSFKLKKNYSSLEFAILFRGGCCVRSLLSKGEIIRF